MSSSLSHLEPLPCAAASSTKHQKTQENYAFFSTQTRPLSRRRGVSHFFFSYSRRPLAAVSSSRSRLEPLPCAAFSSTKHQRLWKTTHFFRHKPGRCRADVASLGFCFRIPGLAIARRRRGDHLPLCMASVITLNRCLAPLPCTYQNINKPNAFFRCLLSAVVK